MLYKSTTSITTLSIKLIYIIALKVKVILNLLASRPLKLINNIV